jgi:hypothetical protein
VSPHVPGERAPAEVQATRETPGRRSAESVTFGDDHSIRSTAVDALKTMRWADTDPQAGYPYAGRTSEQEEEAALRDMGVLRATGDVDAEGNVADDYDFEPELLDGRGQLIAQDDELEDDEGRVEPFKHGALAFNAALRSGEIDSRDFDGPTGVEDEGDGEGEFVYVDADTGELIDEDDLDQYELTDDDGLPPAA